MRPTPRERFDAKWEPEPNTGCFLWTASTISNGYGNFGYQGRVQVAHRVAWQLANGPIPEGRLVLHRCDVRYCVNPDHLYLGDYKDNARDMMARGHHRSAQGEKTHCKRGHRFTKENAWIGTQRGPNGQVYRFRRCRLCRRVS